MIIKIVLTCLIIGLPVLLLLVYGLCRTAAQADKQEDEDELHQWLWKDHIAEKKDG